MYFVSQTGLIIHFPEYTLLVELQLNAIGQLNIVAIALLVNLEDHRIGETSLDVDYKRCRNQRRGNGSGHVTLDLVPDVVGVKVDVCTVSQENIILVTRDFQISLA